MSHVGGGSLFVRQASMHIMGELFPMELISRYYLYAQKQRLLHSLLAYTMPWIKWESYSSAS